MTIARKKSLKSFILLFILGFFILNCLFFLSLQYPNGFSSEFIDRKKASDYPHPIDIVYTWVNGSDARLIEQLNHYKATLYLDRNFESPQDISRSHCPFEMCGFNDHLMVWGISPVTSPSSSSGSDLTDDVIRDALTGLLERALNSSRVRLTRVTRVARSTQSRRAGLVLQSSVSISSLFSNQSEFPVHLPQFSATISQLLVTVSNDNQFGVPLVDHVFLTGLPEMRDASIEERLRRDLASQLPNDSRIIKASATGFLIGLPAGVDAELVNSTFNCSLVSADARLVQSVLILDMGLVTIMSDLTESRFQDNDELKYSLRSLDRFVDLFRHVFIVTNGQVPAWLNTANPRISVVPHWTIFSNRSHLPTFNSAAIEANLHNIPGLAPHFIYLNDDVFFGKQVYMEDFYSPTNGYKIPLGWSVPNCVEACPSSWLADGFCDHDCNVLDCGWDAGDCVKTQGKSGIVDFHQLSNNSLGNIDYFRSLVAPETGIGMDYCSQGCNTNWLADRYCDQPCNVDRCGFDLGDCGDAGLFSAGLPSHKLSREQGQLVPVTNGSLAFVVDLHAVIGPNDTVTGATIDESRLVLSSSYAMKYRAIVLVFRDSMLCRDCPSTPDQLVGVNVTVSRGGGDSTLIQFLLVLNPLNLATRAMSTPISSAPPGTASPLVTGYHGNTGDDGTLSVHQLVSNVTLISRNHSDPNMSVEKLEWERPLEMSHYRLLLQDGLISIAGYRHLISELWYLSQSGPAKHNVSLTAFTNELSIDKLEWGFLPWEKLSKTSTNMVPAMSPRHDSSSRSSGSTMRHVLDLYAESLRHSNRILSRAYSVSQRRVPAHGPHFISTAIFDEAHKKFHDDWIQTSAHRFRSPNDVQFAFAYFYFLMSENITVPITDVLESVDTDHSRSLSVNELRSAVVRIHHNQTVSFQFIDRVLSHINKTCVGRSRSSILGTVSGDIRISDLVACFNWTTLYEPKSTFQYPFTIHEDTDLSFIMISTNHERVLQNLDGLRKTPKKFFCLNDNLPNSADPDLVHRIRADVNQFLDSMFPTASQFEIDIKSPPPGNRWVADLSPSVSRYRQMISVVKVVAILFLILLVFIGLKKILILSRDCRWSWRLSLRGLRNVNNNSIWFL